MATDATGTPTARGIPKYNTATDAPSGKGFNAAMDSIDGLLTSVRVRKNSTGSTFEQVRLNFIEGDGVTFTIAQDDTDDEVDVTINANIIEWMIACLPNANEPPASSFATLDTRNSHLVLDFDASAAEAAVFRGILPTSYGGAGVNVKLIWAATSATSGNTVWNTAFERIPAGALDIDADSFASANAAIAAADATNGETTETTIAHANGSEMDSLAAGEMFRLKVSRNAADGSDTMTGDAELVAVVITEQ